MLEELAYETFLDHPERADRDHSGVLDINEAFSLAFGLSVNNLTMGIGGGISGLSVAVTTGLVILLSFLGLFIGYRLGYRQRTEMSALWAGGLSGGLVILLGIYEYFV